ncbi:hypothetical protein KW830_05920 [Comamonas sp. CMM03]|uniref:hypothetical protein n=1 Tax=Comamonas sp. CMM03 TaxID=2854781 RepID=UPI001C46675C|nr:hypothetical protein [Comamonas sp. CMM03]MBV7417991.1 hypothetical protein [Comamonas sp. CMM03]
MTQALQIAELPSSQTGNRCEEMKVGRTRHGVKPWFIDLCYSGVNRRSAMFWIELTPGEAFELAARLMCEASEAEHANAKQGGAA